MPNASSNISIETFCSARWNHERRFHMKWLQNICSCIDRDHFFFPSLCSFSNYRKWTALQIQWATCAVYGAVEYQCLIISFAASYSFNTTSNNYADENNARILFFFSLVPMCWKTDIVHIFFFSPFSKWMR